MALRFGLFGTGYWAAEVHGAGLAAHPGADLVGVWGRDPAKAGVLAERFAVRRYDDVDALIADIDAVAVALPPHVQAPIAERAAESGRHLLLDKPLALDVAAADRVVAAAERSGVSSVIFFKRYDPVVETFIAECAGKRWDAAKVTMFASIFRPGSPYASSSWRRERGGLWDVGPHAVALILPVLGPVAEVAAVEGSRQTTHVLLRHTSGAVSSLGLTVDAAAAATTREVVFYGEEGIAPVPAGEMSALELFGRAVGELVENVLASEPSHRCDVRFGRDVVAILAAAEASHRTGTTQRNV
jgi:predicted dehydrogenase